MFALLRSLLSSASVSAIAQALASTARCNGPGIHVLHVGYQLRSLTALSSSCFSAFSADKRFSALAMSWARFAAISVPVSLGFRVGSPRDGTSGARATSGEAIDGTVRIYQGVLFRSVSAITALPDEN